MNKIGNIIRNIPINNTNICRTYRSKPSNEKCNYFNGVAGNMVEGAFIGAGIVGTGYILYAIYIKLTM